jgi:hypothetical protein
MNVKCTICKAFRFAHETNSLCCGNNKWPIEDPQPLDHDNFLFQLVSGGLPQSEHFLQNSR